MKELINLKYGPPKSTIIVKSYLKGDNFIMQTHTHAHLFHPHRGFLRSSYSTLWVYTRLFMRMMNQIMEFLRSQTVYA